MASNSVLKSARDPGFHENDPLAELSRIMGLAREEAAGADADFQIDLEQELMGAFSDEARAQANDAVAPVTSVAAPVEAAPAEGEFDEVFSDIFEQETFEEPLDLAPEAPVVADETVVPVVEGELTDALLDEDFVEAFAADDFADADEFAETQVAPVAEIAGVATEGAAAPVFDTAADFADAEADEFDAAFRDLDVAAEQHDENPEYVSEDPTLVEASAAPVFDSGAAFADDETDELDAAFDDLDVAAEQSYEAESDYAVEEPVAASPEPEAVAIQPVSFQPAMSLEDELAALLGVSSPTAAQPFDIADETADEIAVEAYEDDAVSAEFDAAFDDVAYDEVIDEDVPALAVEPEAVEDQWTAEQAAEQLFEAEQADDLLPNPLSADHVYANEAVPSLNDSFVDQDPVDGIAFDDADLDFALSDEDAPAASDEIVVPQPETAEFDAADDLDTAIAEFADEDTWAPEPLPAAVAPPVAAAPAAPVAETRAAPVSTFNWQSMRNEPTPPVAARPPEPAAPVAAAAPDVDDSDPFAALAALAAAPPIMRALGRTNPIAVNPPAAVQNAPRTFAAPRPIPMPAPAYVPPVQRAEPVPPKPATPPLGLRPALTTAAASSAFAAPVARPIAETFAAKPAATAPAATPDDDIPDLDDLLDAAIFAPEVDTVEIQDSAVALADDLDIPDFDQEVPASQQAQFDDLDDDFTSAFNQLSSTLDQRTQAAAPAAPTYYVERSAPAAAPTQPAYAPSNYSADDYDAQMAGFDASMTEDPFADHDPFAGDRYDADLQDDDARPARGRGVLIAAIVAGVAIVGGIGAFALSSGGGDDVPALVRADTTPVKVKPETPGGVVVPNQDGKVYQQVSGGAAPAPAQEKLISSAEEPIAPAPASPVAAAPAAPAADAALPGVAAPQIKSEERVTPADTAQTPPESQDVTAMTPKKVRTMIVRPDGTLVAREDPPAAAPTPDAVTTGMTPVPTAADAQTMAAAEPATVPVPSAVPGAQDDVSILPAEDAAPTVAAPAAEDVIIPEPRPARASTPAAEPVRAAAPEPAREPTPEPARAAVPAAEPAVEVASAPAAAAPSLWSVQIASQPTREGAQASYEDLARRYGGVLGGKGVNIVQAEVSGKGTMWRVRVPSASKNDANILCAKLKTAGGSCFVSQ